MTGKMRFGVIVFLAALPFLSFAQCDDDDPPSGSISANEVGCGGGQVTITFSLSGDDDEFDVQYRIGGSTFSLSNIRDGHTVTYNVSSSTTATLISVTQIDDDDGDRCTSLINQTIDIRVGSPPNLNVSVTNQPGCNQSNGSISAQASGGSQSYQYSLNGGAFQSNSIFSGLAAGTYTVTVRDQAGCETSRSVILSGGSPPNLNVSVTNQPGCNQSNGSISAQASGGSQSYQYSLNGGAFQSNGIFSGLAAGTYTVTVRDQAGCETSRSVTLQNPGNLRLQIAAVVQPTCGNSKDGRITVQAQGGANPVSFSINGGAFQSSNVFGDLSPGTYTIIARDGNNCESSITTTLNNPASGLTNAQISGGNRNICLNVNANLSANLPAGTTGRWTANNSAVRFGDPNSPVTTISANQPGAYIITWTLSAANCPNYSQASIQLIAFALPQANDDGPISAKSETITEVSVLSNDNPKEGVIVTILRAPNKGTAQVLANNTIQYKSFPGESGADSLIYRICLRDCPTSCTTAKVTFLIVDDKKDDICNLDNISPKVIFPEGITPNGDGYNEVLKFEIVDKLGCPINYAKSDISIFNRWGDKVFHQEPYENGWNGTTNSGQELPPGVYYYALRVRREGKKDYVRFGQVSIFK